MRVSVGKRSAKVVRGQARVAHRKLGSGEPPGALARLSLDRGDRKAGAYSDHARGQMAARTRDTPRSIGSISARASTPRSPGGHQPDRDQQAARTGLLVTWKKLSRDWWICKMPLFYHMKCFQAPHNVRMSQKSRPIFMRNLYQVIN
jgi:hypothetical protein